MPIELSKKHLLYMNIGENFWGASLEKFNHAQNDAVKVYLSDIEQNISKGKGLFIWGNNSVGKSFVSAAVCKHVWKEFRVASYCVLSTELAEAWLPNSFFPAHEDSDELMVDRIEDIRFLVIDDIGKEHRAGTGYFETKLGALLRYRARHKRVTFLTANMGPIDFGKIYGASAAQLAMECMRPRELKGPNMRKGRI